MEQLPADARAAPSASAPNDIVMHIASSPKRPRDPAQDNKVSQRATLFDPAMLEIQVSTTKCLLREPARACRQSLAHHTTLTGRCPKSVDTWAPLCEEPQSRSTTSYVAEKLRKQGNSAILAAVQHCSHSQTTPERESTLNPRLRHHLLERADPTTQQRHVETPSSNVATAECVDRKHVLLRRVDVVFDVRLDALEGARRVVPPGALFLFTTPLFNIFMKLRKKKLVRLKIPRLPSALGLSGASGVAA
eukprot:scaffold3128_cov121-Isochrysis_galbana.AAC.4